MKLSKAIEISNDHVYHPEHHHDLDTQNAMLLLIEAGKRCQLARKETSFVGPGLLPGEDPDDS